MLATSLVLRGMAARGDLGMERPLGLLEPAALPESGPMKDLDLSATLGSGADDGSVLGTGPWGLVAIAAIRCVLPGCPDHVADAPLGLNQRGDLMLPAMFVADGDAIHLLA